MTNLGRIVVTCSTFGRTFLRSGIKDASEVWKILQVVGDFPQVDVV
jgi:hypothetical protein